MTLWYKAPARQWLEGLPIGYRADAGQVPGTFRRERIALNRERLWTKSSATGPTRSPRMSSRKQEPAAEGTPRQYVCRWRPVPRRR